MSVPDEAVEAAFEAFYAKCDVDFDAGHAIVAALEAAAPHLMAEAWDEGWKAGAEWMEPTGPNPYRSGE